MPAFGSAAGWPEPYSGQGGGQMPGTSHSDVRRHSQRAGQTTSSWQRVS